MNRLLLRGIPIAESELYRKRSIRIRSKRAVTLSHIHKRNMSYNQSGIFNVGERVGERVPVPRELFTTSSVRHQTTRKRLLPIYKSSVAKEDQRAELA